MARLRGFLATFTTLVALILLLLGDDCAGQPTNQTWLVGGISDSWALPDVPSFFQDWADSVHPRVGDSLIFQWGPASVPLVPMGPAGPAPAPAPAPAGAAQGLDARESLEDPEAFETGQAVPQQGAGSSNLTHSLWVFADDASLDNCDFSAPGVFQLIAPSNITSLEVSFGLSHPGVYRFACNVSTHCILGMRFRIIVGTFSYQARTCCNRHHCPYVLVRDNATDRIMVGTFISSRL
eukprot:jgi/Mesvir1/7051/Mv09167-RA.1